MANHASAKKRNRQRITRTARNRSLKARVRGALKSARLAVSSAAQGAVDLVKSATQVLDRAASKNAIPKKRAARLKGRLATRLHRAAKAG